MDINQINLDNKFKLLEASAGTGKSFTLAHLVLRNVLEKKIKPDEILLLSFTKNTCSELRDKILLRFQDLKLYLQNHNESKIDNTLKDWYLNFEEKEKSKKKIINEIRKIYDPELPVNIYELGLIYDIQVKGKKAEIKMTLTTPNCPVAESLPKEVKEGAMQVEEIDDVDLQLVWDPPWNKDMMSDAAKLELNL